MESEEAKEKVPTKKNKTVRKKFKILWDIIVKLVTLLIVLISLIIIVQKVTNNKESFFGYRIFRVQTGSMIHKYQIGDVILVKKQDVDKIKVGDDVTYLGESSSVKGILITHRVIDIQEVDGKKEFHTQGIANNLEDPVVYGNQINGVVQFKMPILTLLCKLLNNKYIFYFGAVLPLTLYIFFRVLKANYDKKVERD